MKFTRYITINLLVVASAIMLGAAAFASSTLL